MPGQAPREGRQLHRPCTGRPDKYTMACLLSKCRNEMFQWQQTTTSCAWELYSSTHWWPRCLSTSVTGALPGNEYLYLAI